MGETGNRSSPGTEVADIPMLDTELTERRLFQARSLCNLCQLADRDIPTATTKSEKGLTTLGLVIRPVEWSGKVDTQRQA